ncbi:MAG: ribosomal protein L7/L12 [Thermoleophilia bacterium]
MERLKQEIEVLRARAEELERIGRDALTRAEILRGAIAEKTATLSKMDVPIPGDAILLVSWGENKINVIKAIRELTGIGLMEAKNLVEAAPTTIGQSELRCDRSGSTVTLAAAARMLRESGAIVKE